MMNSEFLCVGDYVNLYSDATQGFLCSWQSSEGFNQVYLFSNQSKENPDKISDPQVVTYKVVLLNRYKLNKKYKKVSELARRDADNQQLKAMLAEAKACAEAETDDNRDEQRRLHGKRICYGDIVQIRHALTGKFIHTSTTGTSSRDKNNLTIYLDESNGKHAQFRILPRYRVKAEREPVQFHDQIIFESVKCAGQYFHASLPYQIDTHHYGSELNLGVDFTGFTVTRYFRPKSYGIEEFITGGSVVRIIHKVLEANLVAEGVINEELIEGVHLKIRESDPDRPSTLEPSTSAITYWQVLHETSILHGDVLRWGQHVRLRHMTSGRYLLISDSHVISLNSDPTDPNTVFRLHPISKHESDEIVFDSNTRIEHVLTGRWLHADRDEIYERAPLADMDDSSSVLELCLGNKALRKISSSHEQLFSDAYTLQRVSESLVQDLNHVTGSVHFLQNLIRDKEEEKAMDNKTAQSVCLALKEMKRFLVVLGSTVKSRQKLLRNLRIVDKLVQLLKYPLSDDDENMVKIFSHSFDVLHTYLVGPSRRNKFYFLRYLDFFQNHFIAKENLEYKVAQMLVELIRGNRRILDRISSDQIERFVQLLKTAKSFCYLDLLSVLCVCNGVAIPDNQTFITESLLRQRPNGLFITELGSNLDAGNNDIHISMNNGGDWIPLHIFLEKDGGKYGSDRILFFQHQLDLYKALAFGRNEFSIDVITREMHYLSWLEAYNALTTPVLPHTLRATYCDLLIVLFVDVGDRCSAMDRTSTCFLYGDLSLREKSNKNSIALEKLTTSSSSSSSPSPSTSSQRRGSSDLSRDFESLRYWIQQFLASHEAFIASAVGQNQLTEQVLRLLHQLVKYGYYGDMEQLEELSEPLLRLLSGKRDQPFHVMSLSPDTSNVTKALHLKSVPFLHLPTDERERKKLLKLFRKKGRFEKTIENNAIVNAKTQVLEILDVIFSYKFRWQLNTFIELYKQISYGYSQGLGAKAETVVQNSLKPLISEQFNPYDTSKKSMKQQKKLRAIVNQLLTHQTQLNSDNLNSVLMDLTKYKYDKLITRPLDILNRFYSSKMDMFKVASAAQLISLPETLSVCGEVEEIVGGLRRTGKARLSEAQIHESLTGLNKLIRFCVIDEDCNVPHSINQSVLLNHDVLTLLFDKISSEIEGTSPDLYHSALLVRVRCIHLLKALTRSNDVVQRRVYDRMDALLKLRGVESEIALLLKEAFLGNQSLCLKVETRQMDRVVALIAEHRENVPELLELTISIVKVAGPDTPVRRNQVHVMKHVMKLFHKIASVFDETEDFRLRVLFGEMGERYREYYLALVTLLAICAEGENQLIDSLCKTILDVSETLSVLSTERLDCNAKKPFMLYIHKVYLGEGVEIGTSDIAHSSQLWAYLKSLRQEVIWLYKCLKERTHLLSPLLKTPLPIREWVDMSDEIARAHAMIHYLFDTVFPFLTTFISRYYEADLDRYPDEPLILDQLTVVLVHFCQAVKPHLCSHVHVKVILTSMIVLLSTSSVPHSTTQSFLAEFTTLQGDQYSTEQLLLKHYRAQYKEELVTNEQFRLFVSNCAALYGGHNTVAAQINYTGKNSSREYTLLGGYESLPLGVEFQQHVSCFVKLNHRSAYKQFKRVEILINQLGVSAKQRRQKDEASNIRQVSLDMKCLQILRALLHNEVVKLSPNWASHTSRNDKSLLKRIECIQNMMIEKRLFLMTMPLMSSTNDEIVREMLSFIAALFFDANIKVQNSFLNYCESTRSETFFITLRSKIQQSVSAVKERRALANQNITKASELELLAKRRRFHSNLAIVRPTLQIIQKYENALYQTELKSQKSSPNLIARPQKDSRFDELLNLLPNSLRTPSTSTQANGVGETSGRGRVESDTWGVQNHAAVGEQEGEEEQDENPMVEMRLKDLKKEEQELTDDDTQAIVMETQSIKSHTSTELIEVGEELEPPGGRAMLEDDVQSFTSSSDIFDVKDDGYIELVLKVLGLMCDGQHRKLQEYIRDQPDNVVAVKTVEEVVTFLKAVYSNITPASIELVIRLFEAINEFTCGNQPTRTELVSCKIIDVINAILRAGEYPDCPIEKVFELKQIMGNLIISLIEENGKREMETAVDVKDTLDHEAVGRLICSCYKFHRVVVPKLRNVKLGKGFVASVKTYFRQVSEWFWDFVYSGNEPGIKQTAKTLGYTYTLVMQRFYDLDLPLYQKHFTEESTGISLEQRKAFQFYGKHIASVEIIKDDCIQKVNFRILNKSVLKEEVKEKLKWNVDRSSPTDKIRDFISWYYDIRSDIKHQQKVLSNFFTALITRHWSLWNSVCVLLSLIINIYMLSTWEAKASVADLQNLADDAVLPSALFDPMPKVPDEVVYNDFIYITGAIHNLFSFLVLVGYLLSNHPKLPSFKEVFYNIRKFWGTKDENSKKKKSQKMQKADDDFSSNLAVHILSFKTFYYLIFMTCSILGTCFKGYFFAFHLLNIITSNQLLSGVIQSVTQNGKSLIWVAILGLVIFYLYSLVAFAVFRDTFDPAGDKPAFCQTLLQCTITFLRYGLIGDYDEVMVLDSRHVSFKTWGYLVIFQISFFIIITTIGLNIIFGIIVDTFSELRDKKWTAESDMKEMCFICGIGAYDLESNAKGFNHHVQHEHSMWSYIYYLIYLNDTDPNDYTALDLHVANMLKEQDYDFFPLNRALCLTNSGVDSTESKIDELMQKVDMLVAKQQKEELEKRRKEEQRKQLRWQEEHRRHVRRPDSSDAVDTD